MSGCEYVRTSDEGTSYCTLAESGVTPPTEGDAEVNTVRMEGDPLAWHDGLVQLRAECDAARAEAADLRAETDRLRADKGDWQDEAAFWMAASKRVTAVAVQLRDALEFYADPATYFAIAFFPDPPCGEFMDDWSTHGDPDFDEDDERPGWVARTALADPDVQALGGDR